MLHSEAQKHMLKYWTDEMYLDDCQDELSTMQWNENDNEHTLKYVAYYY